MHMCCDYTIPLFELSTISEMPMNKASRFSGCIYSGRLLYNSRLCLSIIDVPLILCFMWTISSNIQRTILSKKH